MLMLTLVYMLLFLVIFNAETGLCLSSVTMLHTSKTKMIKLVDQSVPFAIMKPQNLAGKASQLMWSYSMS